ncbi:hypothetical protein BH18VER1_BH18VER1_20140 [soil metagenome]
MRRFVAYVIALSMVCGASLNAQEAAPKPTGGERKAGRDRSAEKPKSEEKKKSDDPVKQLLGGAGGSRPDLTETVTTEILADQAFFDSGKSIGIFTGHVIVKDPRFNLQADKLTVYLGTGDVRGLDRAVAEGNVGMVREAPGENGGPPMRSVGRAESAVYTASNGNVELKGTPRVQSGLNSHIATSPGTVMLINPSGQLTTNGPSRTEIRQEPKPPAPPKP